MEKAIVSPPFPYESSGTLQYHSLAHFTEAAMSTSPIARGNQLITSNRYATKDNEKVKKNAGSF